MEAELLCISTSMVQKCPQLPLLPFCLQGLLLLCTGITSHHTPRGEEAWTAAPGKALATGKGFGQRAEELRTRDGSQHVCRLRDWSLENPRAVVHCKVSGSKAARTWQGEAGRRAGQEQESV